MLNHSHWQLLQPEQMALIIEVHPEPEKAMSDGRQSLKPEKFAELVTKARRVAEAVGRKA